MWAAFQHRAGPEEAGNPILSNRPCFCLNDSVATPVNYDTVKCEKIFNKETCSYTVVEQKDPEKTCDVGGWMV